MAASSARLGPTSSLGPSGFAAQGELLIIAELRARLALVDIRDRLVGYLGDNLDSVRKNPSPSWGKAGIMWGSGEVLHLGRGR